MHQLVPFKVRVSGKLFMADLAGKLFSSHVSPLVNSVIAGIRKLLPAYVALERLFTHV